jgi:nucleotide-binding universal stress UspA family protein
MSPYTSAWTGVTPGDGPQDVHIILLDNGRTKVLSDEIGAQALEQTAAEGASLAQAAGCNASSAAAEAAPTWKGIVNAAEKHDSSLIVLGSHGRTGLAGVLIGSVAEAVAEAVAAHSRRSVLIIHRREATRPGGRW